MLLGALAEERIALAVFNELSEGICGFGIRPVANACRPRVQDHPTLRGIPVLVRISIHITVVLIDAHVVIVVASSSRSTITSVVWFRRGVARSEFGECSSATLIVWSIGVISMEEHGTLVTSRVVVVVESIRLFSWRRGRGRRR